MSKLDKLKSVFSDVKKIKLKSVEDIKTDLSEISSFKSSKIEDNKSNFSEIGKKKFVNITSLNSDLSDTDVFNTSDVSNLKSDLSKQSSMNVTDLSSLTKIEPSKFVKTDITTLKSNSNLDVPNKDLNNTDVTKFNSEKNKIRDFNKSKLVEMTSDLSNLSSFKKTNLENSKSDLDESSNMNLTDITKFNSNMSEVIQFGKSDITSFGSVFNTLEVFENTDITQFDSNLDNLVEMDKTDLSEIERNKTLSFNNTDVTTLGDTTDLDDAITTPYNTDKEQTLHASGVSLKKSELDDLDNPLGPLKQVLDTLSTDALSPILGNANLGFTDFWNDGRIFNDYMQQDESEIITDTSYNPEFSNYQWPGPVNFISKTLYGHAAPSGFTLNEYQKAPTHIDVIDDVTSEYFPYNKDLELNMYSTAEHTINEAAYRFPFADNADQKLYDTYKYDPRHSIMPDLIFNVNPYLGTMFDDNLGGLFNTVEDTTDTTHKYSHTLKTINKPAMDTIITSGNLMAEGTGYEQAKLAKENYDDSGGIFGWEEANPDGTFGDNIGNPHSGIYWNGSQVHLNVWYFSGLDGQTPLTAGFNPLQRGLSQSGGQQVRTIQFGYDELSNLGDQGRLGQGALKFDTLYSHDHTQGATSHKRGRNTDRLKLRSLKDNTGYRGKEPYITFNIPEYAGADTHESGWSNDGSRGKSVYGRAYHDEDRMWNFIWNSDAGQSWTAWQFVLQFLNPRTSRIFNPLSPQINAGAKVAGLKFMVNRGWYADMLLGNETYGKTVYEIEHGKTPEKDSDAKGKGWPTIGNNIANFRSGGIVFQVLGGNKEGQTKYKNVGSNVATAIDQLWNFPLMDALGVSDVTGINSAEDLTDLGSVKVPNKAMAVMSKGMTGNYPRGIVRASTSTRSVHDVTPAIKFNYQSAITKTANKRSDKDPMLNSFGGRFSLSSVAAATTRKISGDKVRLSRTYEEIPDGSDGGRYQDFLADKSTLQTSIGPSFKGDFVSNKQAKYAFRNFATNNGKIINDSPDAITDTTLYKLGDFMTLTPIVRSPEAVKVLTNQSTFGTSIANASDNENRIKGSFQQAYLQNGYDESTDPESERHGMPFYFKDLRDGSYITFRAYLEGLNESIAPSWEETSYLGRSEPLHAYSSTSRTLSFTLKLAAQSRDELMIIYEKMNALTSLCYPEYKADKAWHQSWAGVDDPGSTSIAGQGVNLLGKIRMKAPLTQLRIGEYIGAPGVDKNGFDNAQTGFIESLAYAIEDNTPWETQKQYRVPKYITAAISFKVIHDKVPEKNLGNDVFPFYGINNNILANNNQVWPGGSTLPNRDTSVDIPNETGATDKSVDSFDAASLYTQTNIQ